MVQLVYFGMCRLSLVEKCIEAFEQATTNIDHHFALPTHHQLFLQVGMPQLTPNGCGSCNSIASDHPKIPFLQSCAVQFHCICKGDGVFDIRLHPTSGNMLCVVTRHVETATWPVWIGSNQANVLEHANHQASNQTSTLTHTLCAQAKSRVMAVSHVLCHFVNWKLLRDTALNHCLKHLLDRKLSDACIEVAAEILLAVDPWMQENWGYTSRRYLDAYYMRIRSYCAHQIALSMTPEGRWLDLAFHRDVMVSQVAGTLLF